MATCRARLFCGLNIRGLHCSVNKCSPLSAARKLHTNWQKSRAELPRLSNLVLHQRRSDCQFSRSMSGFVGKDKDFVFRQVSYLYLRNTREKCQFTRETDTCSLLGLWLIVTLAVPKFCRILSNQQIRTIRDPIHTIFLISLDCSLNEIQGLYQRQRSKQSYNHNTMFM